MSLNEAQLAAMRIALGACASECKNSILGNLLEAHLKVVAANALLQAGYSILESANRKGQGRLLSLQGGRLTAQFEPRLNLSVFEDSKQQKLSPDLRVWTPCQLVLEFQVRSCFGSQSALFSDNLFDDLRRVGNSVVDGFILAADRPLYDALRGKKIDARGRKARYAVVLQNILPSSDSLAQTSDPGTWSMQLSAEHFAAIGALLQTPFGVERCIVGMWRAG